MKLRALVVASVAAAVLAPPAGAATIDVRIEKTGFAPASVTVNAGDTVRWTNRDTVDHQVVSDTGSFASPILKAGQSFAFAFQTDGTFRYRDALKPSSRGTVRVNAPPPAVTMGATVPIIVFGAETHLQGVVSSKRPGEQVTILQQPYGQTSPTQLFVATTGAGGAFDAAVKPTLLTSFFAQYRGASSGEIRVEVRPKVTLVPARRGWLLARVAGAASFAGKFVYLQRKSPFGQWVSITRYRLGAASGKLFRTPKRPGVSQYRIFLTINQAGPGYLESWSGTQTVRR
jgi:plastocyanin